MIFTQGLQVPVSSRESLRQLFDEAFQYPSAQNYLTDFPIWDPLSGYPKAFHYAAMEKEKICSFVGMRIGELRFNEKQIKVGLIGGVCTKKEYQGQGLAKTLLRQSLDEADRKKLEFVMLWSSDPKIYESFGFKPRGKQLQATIEDLQTVDLPKDYVKKFQMGFDPKILEMMKKRKEGLKRDDQDLLWLSRQSSVLWVHTEKAFAAVGRGRDLDGRIHEWGGEFLELQKLFTLLKSQSENLLFLGPKSELDRYLKKNYRMMEEPLALVRGDHECLDQDFWIWGLDAC